MSVFVSSRMTDSSKEEKKYYVKITPRPNEIIPGAGYIYDFWYFDGNVVKHVDNGTATTTYEFYMPPGIICCSVYYNGGVSVASGDAEINSILSTSDDHIELVYVYGDCEIYY